MAPQHVLPKKGQALIVSNKIIMRRVFTPSVFTSVFTSVFHQRLLPSVDLQKMATHIASTHWHHLRHGRIQFSSLCRSKFVKRSIPCPSKVSTSGVESILKALFRLILCYLTISATPNATLVFYAWTVKFPPKPSFFSIQSWPLTLLDTHTVVLSLPITGSRPTNT